MGFPVADLHCDLLSYLNDNEVSSPFDDFAIGCNLPDSESGKVRIQVFAIYTSTVQDSVSIAQNQCKIFNDIILKHDYYRKTQTNFLTAIEDGHNQFTYSVPSIENASCLCNEISKIEIAFENLEHIIKQIGKPLYIGLTHHGENRFGGGNNTNIGLKDDGRLLLDYLRDKKIAVDLSHASDRLAYEIIEHIDKNRLGISILASHSNFRSIFNHPRNLPDDLVKEIIIRKGLIGINFLRAFVHPSDSAFLYKHIEHGLLLGGENNLCFGADYFDWQRHPDQSRKPFFFPEHSNAKCYQEILKNFGDKFPLYAHIIANLAYKNVSNFMTERYLS